MKMRPVGYVYVLTNASMPELVKVGMTDRHNPRERIDELSSHTGVPENFELAYRAQVFNAYGVEQRAHALLAESCIKKKEFFQCDVIAAIDAVFAAAGEDLIEEESRIELPIEDDDADRLRQGAIRLALLQPRGSSLTGVTRLPFDKQPKAIKVKIAWGLESPTYGFLFYGTNISNAKKLLSEARSTFREVNDFCNPRLLETDAANRVRARQAIQEECDRENNQIKIEQIRHSLEEKERKAKEAERREAERREAERRETERKAQAAQQEATRREAARWEAGRLEATRRDAALWEAGRLEARRRDAALWKAARKAVAARLEAERKAEEAEWARRMAHHKKAQNDLCSVEGCEKNADLRRAGVLYCLAHYYTGSRQNALGDDE